MARFSMPLMLGLGFLGAGALALVSVLARFWGTNPEYADRFLILLGAGWVAWHRKPGVLVCPVRPFLPGGLLLVAGAAGFPVGWYLQTQVAPKPVVLWWLALSWLLAAAGFTLLAAGRAQLRRLAFPLCFVLFALPIPNRVLVPLQNELQQATTSTAAAVLPVLGVSVERDGFILQLPGGDLGVAEACSGVRSVTALTALAAFVACRMNFTPLRGVSLVLLAVPVIAAVNALRVVLSGLIQERIGPEFIQGYWHETLGIGMVLLGLGLVVGLAEWLARGPKEEEAEGPEAPQELETTAARTGFSRAAALILTLAALGTLAAQFLGRGAEGAIAATAPLERLPLVLGEWKGEPQPVSEYVTELLTYDNVVCRTYRNSLGDEVDAWVIFWSSQGMVKGYHHPDVCLKNRGFVVRERDRQPVALSGGGEIPVTFREFVLDSDKKQRQLVLYWTQEGRHVWTEQDEASARLTGDSHRWLSDRLFSAPESGEKGRLVVLLGAPLHGDGKRIRQETTAFARQLAEAVYELCPWARPPSSATGNR